MVLTTGSVVIQISMFSIHLSLGFKVCPFRQKSVQLHLCQATCRLRRHLGDFCPWKILSQPVRTRTIYCNETWDSAAQFPSTIWIPQQKPLPGCQGLVGTLALAIPTHVDNARISQILPQSCNCLRVGALLCSHANSYRIGAFVRTKHIDY